MTGWNESTESEYLVGKEMPPTGINCTLVGIRSEQFQKRDAPEGVKETVFIANFAESGVKDWVINKTGRKFLKEHCGITDHNVGSFAPIPLTLLQTPARGSFPPGIQAVLRTVATPAGPPEDHPPVPDDPPPMTADDVPF